MNSNINTIEQEKKITKENEVKRGNLTNKILTIALLAIFIVASVLICIFAGKPLLEFVKDADRVRAFVDENALLSRVAFVGIVLLQVVVAIIPGEPVELAAGYAFGAFGGLLVCMIGIIIGSIIIFLVVRRFGRKAVRVFFSDEQIDKLQFLKDSPKRNFVMFLLMFIPGTPKDILSYFAGLTDISLGKWLLFVAIGRIPSVLTSTLGAGAIGSKNYLQAAIIFGITFIISGVGWLAYRLIVKKHENKDKKDGGLDP